MSKRFSVQRSGYVFSMLISAGLAGCSSDPPATVAAPPPRPLGLTCADHPVNCAYKAHEHVPPAGTMAEVGQGRETGRSNGPPPADDPLQPLVQPEIRGLAARQERWVLTLTLVSGARQPIDPAIACDFRNADRVVARIAHTASAVTPGQRVDLLLPGPAVSQTYVDGAICRVIGPFQ